MLPLLYLEPSATVCSHYRPPSPPLRKKCSPIPHVYMGLDVTLAERNVNRTKMEDGTELRMVQECHSAGTVALSNDHSMII